MAITVNAVTVNIHNINYQTPLLKYIMNKMEGGHPPDYILIIISIIVGIGIGYALANVVG